MNIEKDAVKKLTDDPKFMEEVVRRALDDQDVVKDLAKDIAGELSDVFGDDPKFREKIVSAAMKDAKFKERLLEEITKELD